MCPGQSRSNCSLETCGRGISLDVWHTELLMGDRKPPKKSSGSSNSHKAQQAKAQANRPPDPKAADKNKKKK